jgi:hypothetical protein
MPRLITFHKILAGCEAGERESWRTFLGEYTPLVFRLAGIYLPSSPETRTALWRETLAALAAGHFELLRSFDHQAEREFLADLRSFLLEQGAAKLDGSRDVTGPPRPRPETVSSLVKPLPLLHQEILFLKLAGYSDATLESMLRITPSIAEQGLARLQADYAVILRKEQDVCLWPAAWLELLRHARGAKTGDCGPFRQFVRIQDGQTSWYEKEPLEKHMATCLHCLERWTALRELVYWRRDAQPREETEALLSSLPLQALAAGPKKKSLLKRVLGS